MAPSVGDSAVYERTIKEKDKDVWSLYRSKELLAIDTPKQEYLVRHGLDRGDGFSYRDEISNFVAEEYAIFDRCEELQGQYVSVSTKLGTLQACYRITQTRNYRYEQWHSNIPFGLVRYHYVDSDIEFDHYIVSFD